MRAASVATARDDTLDVMDDAMGELSHDDAIAWDDDGRYHCVLSIGHSTTRIENNTKKVKWKIFCRPEHRSVLERVSFEVNDGISTGAHVVKQAPFEIDGVASIVYSTLEVEVCTVPVPLFVVC